MFSSFSNENAPSIFPKGQIVIFLALFAEIPVILLANKVNYYRNQCDLSNFFSVAQAISLSVKDCNMLECSAEAPYSAHKIVSKPGVFVLETVLSPSSIEK